MDAALTSEHLTVRQFIKSLKDHEFVQKKPTKDKPQEQDLTAEQLTQLTHVEPREKPALRPDKNTRNLMAATASHNAIRNGYINAKMIRVKQFHMFLWNYSFEQEQQNQVLNFNTFSNILATNRGCRRYRTNYFSRFGCVVQDTCTSLPSYHWMRI
jgi:hypothetical protein